MTPLARVFIFFLIVAETLNLGLVYFYSSVYAERVLHVPEYSRMVAFFVVYTLLTILSGFVVNPWMDRHRRFGAYFGLAFFSFTLLFATLALVRDFHVALLVSSLCFFCSTSFHSVMQAFLTIHPCFGFNLSHILCGRSLGWAFGGLLGGWLFDREGGLAWFTQIYLLFAVFNLAVFSLVCLYRHLFLRPNQRGETRLISEKTIESDSFDSENRVLFKIFLIFCGVNFAKSMFDPFFPNYYATVCGAAMTWTGFAIFGATLLGAVASVFCAARGTGVRQYFVGNLLTVGYFLFIFFVRDPWLILCLYVLPFYVLIYLGSSQMMKIRSSPANRSRAMGLRQNGEAMGNLFGQYTGGQLADWFGLANLPAIAAVCTLLVLAPAAFFLRQVFRGWRALDSDEESG